MTASPGGSRHTDASERAIEAIVVEPLAQRVGDGQKRADHRAEAAERQRRVAAGGVADEEHAIARPPASAAAASRRG